MIWNHSYRWLFQIGKGLQLKGKWLQESNFGSCGWGEQRREIREGKYGRYYMENAEEEDQTFFPSSFQITNQTREGIFVVFNLVSCVSPISIQAQIWAILINDNIKSPYLKAASVQLEPNRSFCLSGKMYCWPWLVWDFCRKPERASSEKLPKLVY